MINFCKGRGAFRELDGQYTDKRAVLPLENVTYYASLITNVKNVKKKNQKTSKDKNILKGGLDVQNGHSAVVNRS